MEHNVYVHIPIKGKNDQVEVTTQAREVVRINQDVYGRFIGHHGKDIANFQRKFNVKVYFPDPWRKTDHVGISGPKENTKKAKSELLYLAESVMSSDAVKRDAMWRLQNC